MILVDTSVWIEVFRARSPLDLEASVDLDNVVTCLPIVQEILQGFRKEDAYRRARDAMLVSNRRVTPRKRYLPGRSWSSSTCRGPRA